MRTTNVIMLMIAAVVLAPAVAAAHGDAPHPKCKKGYVLTDDHKCVKAQ